VIFNLKEGFAMFRNKRSITPIIAILCVAMFMLLIAGCGAKKEEASNGAGKDAPKEAETVEIVMGHPFAAQHPISQQILLPLVDELAEKSNGRIRLTIHAGGAVTSPATIREDVATGVIDMGWTLQGYTPGKYPLTDVVELPFQFDSTLQASYVLWELLQQSPDFQEEYGDVKVVGLWMTDPGELLTKDPVLKPEDLQGMRIRFSGAAQESMINKFGGTPVGMAMPEVYDALQRGVIDGVANGPSVIESYKLNEVIKNATRGLNSFYSAQVIFMNKNKWDSLSAEDQEILASLTGEAIYKKATDIYSAGYQKGFDMAVESNVAINDITPEQREEWKAKTEHIVDEWLERVNGIGLPGQEILDLMRKLAEEYKP
jgi:TRAP-type C4-dicarboxylate transport system substrate-binding protein